MTKQQCIDEMKDRAFGLMNSAQLRSPATTKGNRQMVANLWLQAKAWEEAVRLMEQIEEETP